MDRMGSVPILPVKWTVTIGTMINVDGDGHGHVHGTCKQALTTFVVIFETQKIKTYMV